MLMLGAGNALALGSDTVFIYGYAGALYDTNIFRLSGQLDPQDDTLYNYGVGVSADVPYGRQRFQGSFNVYNYHYERFDEFDYVGGNARLNWAWRAGNDAFGDLGWRRGRTLQNFSSLGAPLKNIIDTQSVTFAPRYALDSRWELQGGISYSTSENGLPQSQINDFKQTNVEGGARYVSPSNNSTGLKVGYVDGRFPNRVVVAGSTLDSAFQQWTGTAFVDWGVTGASRLQGGVGYVRRDHPNLSERNFQGFTANLTWNWTPTGKTVVKGIFRRDIGGVEDLEATYARTYTVAIQPSYQLTAKIKLRANAQYQDYEYFGNTGFSTIFIEGRQDKVRLFSVGATYDVARYFSLFLDLSHGSRTSNIQFGDYEFNQISLNGQLTF